MDGNNGTGEKDAFEEADGIIVLLDALGIKGIWNRRDPSEVMETWNVLRNEYEVGMQLLSNDLRDHGYSKRLRFVAFSDTIIISLPVETRPVGSDRGRIPLWWTIISMGEVLIRLFRQSLGHRFYFRGCLSTGRFFRSENMIIGPAVDEAAEYYTLPEWCGISASPSASKILTDVEEMKSSTCDYFIQYDIPLKNMTERKGWVLDWVKPRANTEVQNPSLRQIIYDESMRVNGISEYFKIKNTLVFYDWITSAQSSIS